MNFLNLESNKLRFFDSKYSFLLIVAVVLLVYGKSACFSLTNFDDVLLVVSEQKLNIFNDNFWNVFLSDVFYQKETNDIYYRPILSFSFILDYYLGNTTQVGHILNLVYFICSLFSIYFILTAKFTSNNALVLAVLLILAVNPIFTSTAVWLPGRNDSLLCLFIVSSFYYLTNLQTNFSFKNMLLHSLLLLAALFTKENAITLFPLFTAYPFILNQKTESTKQTVLRVIVYALLTAVFLVLRHIALASPPQFISQNFFENLVENAVVLPLYIGKFITAIDLCGIPILPDMNLWPSAIGIVCLSLLISFSKNKKQSIFGLLWFIVLLLPGILFVNPFIENTFHFEHRTLTSFFGIVLMVLACFNDDIQIKNKVVYVLPILISLYYGFQSLQYSNDFKDSENFFINTISKSPNCNTCPASLLTYYVSNNKQEEGLNTFLELTQSNKLNITLHTHLAMIYTHLGNDSKAQETIDIISSRLKNNIQLHVELVKYYYKIKDIQRVKHHISQGLKLDPRNHILNTLKQKIGN